MSSFMTDVPAKESGVFRVLHTADWHLGKLLGDLSREKEHERFLSFLLELIGSAEVDVLIVAGDVFDSSNPPQSALTRYYNFLSRLSHSSSCSVVVVAGNHDSPALIEAPKRILGPLRVHVVGAVPEDTGEAVFALPDKETPNLVVAAIPFLRDRDVRTGQSGQSAAEIQKSLVDGIQRRYDEAATAAAALAKQPGEKALPILATGHLTVTGSSTSDSEREIHVGGLGSFGGDRFPEAFSYVALGHLHRPQAAGGEERVRYSGSPIALSFSETKDKKAVQIIDYKGAELISSQSVLIPKERELVQLTCSRSELEKTLQSFTPEAGGLEPWVEIVVTDPVPGENLFEVVQEAVEGRPFSVVRVVGKASTPTALQDGDAPRQDLEDSILDRPGEVFAFRLEQEEGLSPDEIGNLKVTFDQLVELHGESSGESVSTTKGGSS